MRISIAVGVVLAFTNLALAADLPVPGHPPGPTAGFNPPPPQPLPLPPDKPPSPTPIQGGTPKCIGTCGTRGGPGYRGPNGQCVGWESICRICGNPPTTRCTPECVNPAANEAAELCAKIREDMKKAHERARAPI
jgi:hypothetical protein